QKSPYRHAPLAWRRYQDALLRAERLVRAGDPAGAEKALGVARDARARVEALAAGPALTRPPSLALVQPRARAIAATRPPGRPCRARAGAGVGGAGAGRGGGRGGGPGAAAPASREAGRTPPRRGACGRVRGRTEGGGQEEGGGEGRQDPRVQEGRAGGQE